MGETKESKTLHSLFLTRGLSFFMRWGGGGGGGLVGFEGGGMKTNMA